MLPPIQLKMPQIVVKANKYRKLDNGLSSTGLDSSQFNRMKDERESTDDINF